jgi:predicted RNA binding protein YcfA (HicA-like mRNA interferase family)
MVRAFERAGFVKNRKKGSHIIMTKPGVARPLVIPDRRELTPTVITSNLKTAGLGKKQYLALLQGEALPDVAAVSEERDAVQKKKPKKKKPKKKPKKKS